jgi:hypothetical protein
MPYEEAKLFTYHPTWTGHLFTTIGFIVRVVCLDPHDELVAAWKALIAAGFPPEATARFGDLTAVGYDVARDRIRPALAATGRIAEVRLAKEFVKFNERCHVRLLGDMRSYNYVVAITPDFDDVQYRIRAIDFDQQSYEGRRRLYLPQFFKENLPLVKMGMELINTETVEQYENEERSLIARRLVRSRYRIKDLLDCMEQDSISSPEKIASLAADLAAYHQHPNFLLCANMGAVLKLHLKLTLRKQIRKVTNF